MAHNHDLNEKAVLPESTKQQEQLVNFQVRV